MPNPRTALPFLAGIIVAMASCAPKASVVEPSALAPKKPEEIKPVEPAVPEPPTSAMPDDGIRGLSNMLEMPKASDFRATNPSIPKTDGQSGTVITRPPTEPPSRVKPKDSGSE